MDVNLHICVTYVLNHDAAIWVSDLTKNNFIFVTSTIYMLDDILKMDFLVAPISKLSRQHLNV